MCQRCFLPCCTCLHMPSPRGTLPSSFRHQTIHVLMLRHPSRACRRLPPLPAARGVRVASKPPGHAAAEDRAHVCAAAGGCPPSLAFEERQRACVPQQMRVAYLACSLYAACIIHHHLAASLCLLPLDPTIYRPISPCPCCLTAHTPHPPRRATPASAGCGHSQVRSFDVS